MYDFSSVDFTTVPLWMYWLLAIAFLALLVALFQGGVAYGRWQTHGTIAKAKLAVDTGPIRVIVPDKTMIREMHKLEVEVDMLKQERRETLDRLEVVETTLERKDRRRATYLRLLNKERDRLATVLHAVPEVAHAYATPPIERRLRLVEEAA